ncbi:hypothetical protein [Nonomuraea dietziae]|uniref:hypothetical protein n=1 Tax=Nonomuraea dietziae TaxID=65515 RepID=UPI0031D76BF8
MIFLTTLYLQQTLGFSPLVTGLIFGVPGLAAVAARGDRRPLHRALRHPQGPPPWAWPCRAWRLFPLVFLGADRMALVVLIPALFIGFFGHVTCIVAYTVTGTSGLPDEEQGLATGLTSMTQQVAITVGIPILSAVAADAERRTDRHPPRAERERGRDAPQRGPRLVRTTSARRSAVRWRQPYRHGRKPRRKWPPPRTESSPERRGMGANRVAPVPFRRPWSDEPSHVEEVRRSAPQELTRAGPRRRASRSWCGSRRGSA